MSDKYYYKVDLIPREPYTLGLDKDSSYGEENTGTISYIMKTHTTPDQTTVLGVLRYLLLQNNGLLNTEFNYAGKQSDVEAKIGKESFRFKSDKEQDFGVIDCVSPVFISNEKGEIYIRNPFCNKGSQEYVPMKLSQQVCTSHGTICLPDEKAYKAKDGYGKGYIEIKSKEILDEDVLFNIHIQPGNRISVNGIDEKETFYKREIVEMKNGYFFSVYLTLKEQFNIGDNLFFVYIGRKKNLFSARFTCVSEEETKLEKRVEDAFSYRGIDNWYYALSDVYYGSQSITYDDFAIVEEKNVRNIETVLFGETKYLRRKKKNERIHLVRAGSVFKKKPVIENKNCENIGYNKIIQLGE